MTPAKHTQYQVLRWPGAWATAFFTAALLALMVARMRVCVAPPAVTCGNDCVERDWWVFPFDEIGSSPGLAANLILSCAGPRHQ